jgi:hypothetical protein
VGSNGRVSFKSPFKAVWGLTVGDLRSLDLKLKIKERDSTKKKTPLKEV